MAVRFRSIPALATLLVICGGLSCSESESGGGSATRRGNRSASDRGFATPEATFAAALDAVGREDWRAYYDCFSEEGRQRLIKSALFHALSEDRLAGVYALTGERPHPLVRVVETYGLQGRYTSQPTELTRMAEELPDPVRFLADVYAADREADDGVYPPLIHSATMQDLSIDGEAARGNVVQEREGRTEVTDIQFQKTAEGWRMNYVFIPSVD